MTQQYRVVFTKESAYQGRLQWRHLTGIVATAAVAAVALSLLTWTYLEKVVASLWQRPRFRR